MDKDTSYKKLYIYENIYKVNDHTQIINFIDLNNIKYTENNNGIFLNISILNDKIINKLYSIVYNIQNYNNNNNKIIDLRIITKKVENKNNSFFKKDKEEEKKEKDEKEREKKEKKIDQLTFDNFYLNEYEKEVILESKKYYY